MPRIRSVHPEICEDITLAEVSAYAERTFVRLWTHLDDEGRGVDEPKLLKARLYPLHDSMTVERVEKDLAELEAKGLLQRYEVDGKRYLSAKPQAWHQWQKPQRRKPSKLPAPSRTSRVHVADADAMRLSGGEWSGDGQEGEGSGEGESPCRTDLPATRTRMPQEVRTAFKAALR